MTVAGDPKYKDKDVIGFIEPVICISKTEEHIVLARIDSGATRSSIDSHLVEQLGLGPFKGERTVKNAHGYSSRKLVEVTIELAGKRHTELFTVANRKHMKFPILIGGNILTKGFLIDPNKKTSTLNNSGVDIK